MNCYNFNGRINRIHIQSQQIIHGGVILTFSNVLRRAVWHSIRSRISNEIALLFSAVVALRIRVRQKFA